MVADQRRRKTGRGTRLRALTVGAVAAVGIAAVAQPTSANETDATQEALASASRGSMYAVVDQIGARDLWASGITGAGVNVAVLDTGVAPVGALSDQVVAMVDLSGEARVPEARFVDTYGHGTHMAGIIAGRTPGAVPADAHAHPEWFVGVAPDAGIVSVKVADNTGAADLTQVIAGVDWVVDHAEQLDIRVLNLSYSSGSSLSYTADPLAFAVERAVRAGIVVVVAAGNDGKQSKVLASPANDPHVIAVAGAEASSPTKFTVPKWAASGDGIRNPDVSAPGAHIESLRAPLSRIDLEHPEGFVSDETFRGSGSSQAAAVVSGAVALLLQARPDLTPYEVRALLQSGTAKVSPSSSKYSGAGLIQLAGLVDRPTPTVSLPAVWSAGDGSLGAARGGRHVMIDGAPIVGEVTVLGSAWSGTRWSGTRWSGGEWDGTRWSSGEWMGTRWSDATWTGAVWLGDQWAGTRWSGTRWSADTWTAAAWSGTRWSGTRWSDDSWSAAIWEGTRWSGTRWSGTRWSSASWS